MAERRPGEGRYAHIEREQRWVATGIPPDARRRSEFHDRYIHGTRLRLRRVTMDDDVHFKLGQKVRVSEADPELVRLTNIYLSADEYEVLTLLPGSVLHKTRWVTSWAGIDVAVDQFHGHLSGLVLAEAELAPDAELLDLPDLAVRDVTHDERFSGGALAAVAGADLAALMTEVAHQRSL